MTLQEIPLQREFIYAKQSGAEMPLPEINVEFTPEQIMDHYSSFYPELTTGIVEGPIIKDNGIIQYRFSSRLGEKG